MLHACVLARKRVEFVLVGRVKSHCRFELTSEDMQTCDVDTVAVVSTSHSNAEKSRVTVTLIAVLHSEYVSLTIIKVDMTLIGLSTSSKFFCPLIFILMGYIKI